MTVKELVEELQEMPQDMEVMTSISDEWGSYFEEIEKPLSVTDVVFNHPGRHYWTVAVGSSDCRIGDRNLGRMRKNKKDLSYGKVVVI